MLSIQINLNNKMPGKNSIGVSNDGGTPAPTTNDVDELYEIRTYFYIGAYQQCLNEILRLTKVCSSEKDCFMWRTYLAQNKYRVVMDGIGRTLNEKQFDVFAVYKLAEYFVATTATTNTDAATEKRMAIIKYFDEKFLTHTTTNNGNDEIKDEHQTIGRIAAATIYYNEGLYENALRILNEQYDLECLSFQIQCLLKMNRIDLGKKKLKKMQEIDEDATLTQMATAWIYIEMGGEKLQDAYFIYQDFCDKFMITNLLLNGQAICLIGQEKYDEAEIVLRDGLDKDSNDYNTLVNLIVLSQHQQLQSSGGGGGGGGGTGTGTGGGNNQSQHQSGDIINRYLSQIKDAYQYSGICMELEKKESEFQRLCLKYEPSKNLSEINV